MKPRVVVIILCYNGLQDTLACLHSLQALDYPAEAVELLVVDNASSDGTPQSVREHFPSVSVIETGANLGYAAGNNVGLRYALEHGFDYALLLNNDTEVDPAFLSRLIDIATTRSDVGIFGPLIYYHHEPTRIWSAGGIIDRRRGDARMRGLDELDRGQHEAAVEVDFISGCALLIRRAALETAGLLDERFFMYYEETEWCARAIRHGWRCLLVPQSKIWHKIRPDRQAESPRIVYYMARNRLLFLRATGANHWAWLNALLFQDLRTYLSWRLRPRWRHRGPHRRALGLAWADFWLGRFGRRDAI